MSPKMPPNARQLLEALEQQSQALNERDQDDAARAKLVARREAARECLNQTGWPTRKHENWHYTGLTPLFESPFALADTPDDDRDPAETAAVTEAMLADCLPPFATIRLVFVDGVYSDSLSAGLDAIDDSLSIEMADADAIQAFTLEDLKGYAGVQDGTRNAARPVAPSDQPNVDDVFVHINEMLLDQGLTIRLAPNAVLEQPLQILQVVTQDRKLVNLRTQFELGHHAQMTWLNQVVSLSDQPRSWVNRLQQVSLGEGAVARQLDWQDLNAQSLFTGLTFVDQAAHSQWQTHSLALGARWSRQQGYVCLNGEGADAEQNTLAWVRGQQLTDSRTETQHGAPHCTSRQLHKFVVQDQARGVFNGMIGVARAAQKTDGQMDNKNLLLSPKAKMDTKPQLEIYADDVACSHGCASGEIDADQIFYAQARGIQRDEAVRMITRAFLLEPLESIAQSAMRHWLHDLVSQRLAQLPALQYLAGCDQ
ncbi:Fe-S cluster assembly protein SufD [Hydrogenovibrio halophilus]|uniref:Fe-S cluster assembly protein SufD n=1 Tax=Hydrogenovibrio halophilus TaxID=373391 RepID=UPI00037ADA36|nr:Fe-S cluster assembly protein SufD [Hydrogenovibrio halophilus]